MAQLNNLVVNGNARFLNRASGNLFATTITNNIVSGTGTAGQDKGSGVSPRYFPAKWTFNTGFSPSDGDRLVIKIPVAGHDYGDYISIDNGATYHPVVLMSTGRCTTHFPANTCILVVFEASGSATSVMPAAGGDARVTVTGGAWRVINYYDSNNAVTQNATSTNANYEVLFSVTADNTTRTEGARKNSNLIFNPVAGLKIGSSTQSAFPTTGIQVHDVRSVNFTPGALDQGVNFFFSNNTMPNTNWWAGLHVKGWTGAYAAWEIVGSAHNNDSRTTPLYVRSSNVNSTWGSWRKIYDTSNPPSKSDIGLGNVENKSSATIRGELTSANVTDALGYTPPTSDTNTHRPIQVNGTEILGNNTTALNLKAGSNVSVTNSSGTVTIAATDTNTTYTLGTSGSSLTLTPSSGTAQTVGVTDVVKNALGVDTTAEATLFLNKNGGWAIPQLVSQAEYNTLNGNRYVLFASDNSVAIGAAYKSHKMWFNPAAGKLYVNGYIEAVNDMTATTIYANSEFVCGTGIELGTKANDSLSFIDFHWNTTMTGNDFTARICQRAESTVDLIGKNSSTWGIWRAASFSIQSSIHAKENIQDVTVEDAKKLLQLRPVTFNYKNGGLTDQVGLIAEEVYLVMPKMVIGSIDYNPEEPWNTPSIDYSKFTPYLIKMIQEQQKEIDELKKSLNM